MAEGWFPERLPKDAEGKNGETQAAYNAFCDYCRMGAGRSLSKLAQAYADPVPGADEPPTVHISTLKVWSSRYHWQDRIQAYDAKRQERLELESQRIEDEGLRDGDRMLDIWERMMRYLERAFAAGDLKRTEVVGLDDLISLRRQIDNERRRAVGLPERYTASDVTSQGEKLDFPAFTTMEVVKDYGDGGSPPGDSPTP